MNAIRHERMAGDGISLHVARAGDGVPVILLHGFPENWRSWKHQVPALVSAGFSVLAPDLRGYGESDRPARTEAYHLRHLVADVAALARASGHARVHVVGHDWGGIVAWTFAGAHPELLDRLAILNAPHSDLYFHRVRGLSWQVLKSWYVLLFRMPRISEWILSWRDFHLLRDLFRRQPFRPAFDEQDVEAYLAALARPGALTAALNYYRANAAPDAVQLARSARVDAPTLVIWGERDSALDLSLLDGLERVAPRVRVHRIADASHWVQNEAPGEVNRALIEFLSGRDVQTPVPERGSARP